jgi:dethiobiotin synthetase
VLGCGTGAGKTRVSVALLRELVQAKRACIGLKPIESGVDPGHPEPVPGSDAHALAQAGSFPNAAKQHPLYAFSEPLSPHLAARRLGVEIDLNETARWVRRAEESVTPLVMPHMALWTVIESAGGVFSPLRTEATNFELARLLEPALWILVAADSLGVLHELSATTQAMRARGREPDHVVLSAARSPDASTGSNARELQALRIVAPTAVLARDDDRGIRTLAQRLLADEQ